MTLTAVLVAVALFQFHVHTVGGKGQTSFGFTAVLGAAFLWSPANGALVGFLAGALSTLGPDLLPLLRGRRGAELAGLHSAYNGCTGALAGVMAGTVFHLGMALPHPGNGRLWLFGMAGALVYFLTSTALTSAILATVRGRDILDFWRTEMVPTSPVYILGGGGTVLFLILFGTGHWEGMALLALGPVFVLYGIYRCSAEALLQRQHHIRALEGANASLVASLTPMSRPDKTVLTEPIRATAPVERRRDRRAGRGGVTPPRIRFGAMDPADLVGTVEALAREAMKAAPGTTALVALMQGKDTIRAVAGQGLYSDRVQGLTQHVALSSWGEALRQGRSLRNVPPDQAVLDAIPTEQPPSLRSALVTPLISHRKPLGVVCVYHTRKNAYTEQDAERLALVAEIVAESLAASVLENSRRNPGERTGERAVAELPVESDGVRAVEDVLRQARESRTPFALVLVDLRFDDVLAGQSPSGAEGAEQLKNRPSTAADAISSCVRPTDSVARLTPTRYLLLLYEARPDTSARICARILAALDRLAELRGLPGGAVAGFGFYPDDGSTARALFEAAEDRLAQTAGPPQPRTP